MKGSRASITWYDHVLRFGCSANPKLRRRAEHGAAAGNEPHERAVCRAGHVTVQAAAGGAVGAWQTIRQRLRAA